MASGWRIDRIRKTKENNQHRLEVIMGNKQFYHIQWKNNFSGEQGYVGSVRKAKGYFINSWTVEDAKNYRSVSAAEKDLAVLEELGETRNNTMTIVSEPVV